MGTVRAADPIDQAGFDFAKRIAERFGPASVPLYDLGFTPTTAATGVGITAEGAITRYNLTGSVVWTLTRHADAVRMTGGTVDSFTSYSATGSTVAGLAAKEDAARRLMVILADKVMQDIMISAGRWPK